MSLFTKIFLAMSISMGLFFAVVVVYIINIQSELLLNKLKRKIENNNNHYSKTLTRILYTLDEELILTTLNSLYLEKEIVIITLTERHEEIDVHLDTKKSIDKNFLISKSYLNFNSLELGTLTFAYSKDVINEELRLTKLNIVKFSLSLYIILLSTILSLIYSFIKSIRKLTYATTEISSGNLDTMIDINSNDEIGLLANKFKLMQKSIKNQQFLIQQHKLSLLGQLLGFISHEWKEPLNKISSYIVSIQIKNEDKELAIKLNKCQQQIDFMSNTMSTFKSFYVVNSDKNVFYFDKAIGYNLELLKNDFLMNNIHVTYENNNKKAIKGNQSEFSQIFLILFNNSKEAFISKRISKREVSIIINNNVLKYIDSAEGVKEEDLKNIFSSEFSTKKENMGIGLYMAKLIIEEKFNAKIEAKNTIKGLCFTITLQNEETHV